MPETDFLPALITFEEVAIIKEENLILSGVSFVVHVGEWVYLIGRVGSGKTSIVKTLIGEIPIRSGKALAVGFDLRRLKRRQIPYLRREIGVVFQDFQLLMDRTVFDNLAFVLKATGWRGKKRIEGRIYEVLDQVGMRSKSHKMPHQLSGGEQQRIGIARAILNHPPLIVADEPTGNLDGETAVEILNLFSELHKNHGLTIFMVTHNRGLVQRFPGRILRCEGGRCTELDIHQEIDFSDER
ncbi:MAG: ATP-binding cassette domain-containing protein [Bacteroidetes bacterium]|nr:ATP-binding cassette domain-containing protein [Bacteroidota bacterium]